MLQLNFKQIFILQNIQVFRQLAERLNEYLIICYNLEILYQEKTEYGHISDISLMPVLMPKFGANRKKIPKTATIVYNDKEIFYNFHGTGCHFEYEGKIINFNYFPTLNDKLVYLFGGFDIFRFIQSTEVISNEAECWEILKELAALGFIENIHEPPFAAYYLKDAYLFPPSD